MFSVAIGVVVLTWQAIASNEGNWTATALVLWRGGSDYGGDWGNCATNFYNSYHDSRSFLGNYYHCGMGLLGCRPLT
ncbi:MAG: hypothetical protein V7L25_18030 [Nostoc sp.]|uniref:hypothetical protein n=1 Tax=Nostoc sp. TaxID=1180 RepID=UPI002FF07286